VSEQPETGSIPWVGDVRPSQISGSPSAWKTNRSQELTFLDAIERLGQSKPAARILAYRAAAANTNLEELAAWRWQQGLWTSEDRRRIDERMRQAYSELSRRQLANRSLLKP
jgi:hypothetical protein